MAWGEGEHYSNARWYDPQLGRFITEDPARSGLNWFAYVHNNPLAYVDPTGLDAQNPGNEGFSEKGDPVIVRTRVPQTVGYTASETPIVKEEREAGRGQTAQRIEALANGGLQGTHLVTQKNLEGKVSNWDSACHFLSIIAGPQDAKGQYFTAGEVQDLIGKFQSSEALLTEEDNVLSSPSQFAPLKEPIGSIPSARPETIIVPDDHREGTAGGD